MAVISRVILINGSNHHDGHSAGKAESAKSKFVDIDIPKRRVVPREIVKRAVDKFWRIHEVLSINFWTEND